MASDTQNRTKGLDQATRLRELVRRRRRSVLTLAVTSGKGGVGKSNIAVNLSICLAAHGIRVTLIDVDMGLANADLLMSIQPRYTLSHVLAGVRSIDEVSMPGPGGIRFVPGASGMGEIADMTEFERQNLIAQFSKLETNTDIVLLDCGAGISRNVISFAMAADRVLVVTTPQPTAMTDAYAMIKSLHRERCRGQLCLLVNMAESRVDATATFDRIAGVAEKFLKYPIADHGYVLHDIAVEQAVRERCPFVVKYPGSNAGACVAAMANDLARSFVIPKRRGNLFSRVAGLFV
jgi:flagellar biosynthesis protein FlhG